MVVIEEQIARLYEKDTKEAYAHLLELEAISREGNTLLPYLGEFIAMLQSDQYTLRMRGFRLLCLQAQWDTEGVIDAAIENILRALNDDKPTAVRQVLQYLVFLVTHKKHLSGQIVQAVRKINLSQYKDSMAPLIGKDIDVLLRTMEF